MSARTPKRRNEKFSHCLLSDILFSRGLRGSRGGALASRAYLAGGLYNEMHRMGPRLPRSLREIKLRDYNARLIAWDILSSHRKHRTHRNTLASRACLVGCLCNEMRRIGKEIARPLHLCVRRNYDRSHGSRKGAEGALFNL